MNPGLSASNLLCVTLQHSLCSVSLADSLDTIKSAPTAGFVLISEVDTIKQTLTLLAPTMANEDLQGNKGLLPKSILIVGAAGATGSGGLRFTGI